MADKASASVGLSRLRLAILHVAILAYIAALISPVIAKEEFWPFCRYAMFSKTRTPKASSKMRVLAIPRDEIQEVKEIANIGLYPLSGLNVRAALRHLIRKKKPDRVDAALADLLRLYEKSRRNGKHDGPPLKGLRVLKIRTEMKPGASTPSTREEIVAEYFGTP